MSFVFNPFTGRLDVSGGSETDLDLILCDNFFDTLYDETGNILIGI